MVADHYPGLSFQARQFLKTQSNEKVPPPFVMDLFLLDAMTEILESPLRLLSYVNRRTQYDDQFIADHELTILAYHLKQNLWLQKDVDLVQLDASIAVDLDISMYARREGAPGPNVPDGILTRLSHTSIAKIIGKIDAQDNPALIDLGFMLLTLREESVRNLSDGIDQIVAQTNRDGKHHDVALMAGGETGITIHCNGDSLTVARDKLERMCALRKYRERCPKWYGIALGPDGGLRIGLSIEGDWQYDPHLAEGKKYLPAAIDPKNLFKTSQRQLSGVSMPVQSRKTGRNEKCPCGSGKKCLDHVAKVVLRELHL